jgi:holo-[acyl-carrier protein] synthase
VPDEAAPGVLVHGVDLIEVPRIERMLGQHPERFVERCFTASEREYCEAGGPRRAERYAARFAAKEAVFKALGTGWGQGVAWTDVEVRRDDAGAPSVHLTGRAALRAAELGVERWAVSMSHTESSAMASVIGST